MKNEEDVRVTKLENLRETSQDPQEQSALDDAIAVLKYNDSRANPINEKTISELDMVIANLQEQVNQIGESSPEKAATLINLGLSLRIKYDITKDISDLISAINHLESSLNIINHDSPELTTALRSMLENKMELDRISSFKDKGAITESITTDKVSHYQPTRGFSSIVASGIAGGALIGSVFGTPGSIVGGAIGGIITSISASRLTRNTQMEE
ncbi:MAG: hypothetical protein OHK0022_27330 [Roseiflexaceae bacterium]